MSPPTSIKPVTRRTSGSSMAYAQHRWCGSYVYGRYGYENLRRETM